MRLANLEAFITHKASQLIALVLYGGIKIIDCEPMYTGTIQPLLAALATTITVPMK